MSWEDPFLPQTGEAPIHGGDAAAGDHPVPAVFAVPGPHLDAGPVVDPPAVGSLAAGTAVHFCQGRPTVK